jgi:integrase
MPTKNSNTPEMPARPDLARPVTLKDSTIKTYKTIYDRRYRRALDKREVNPDEPVIITPMDLVNDWITDIGVNRPKTANLERAAIIWGIGTMRKPGWADAYTRMVQIRQMSLYGDQSGGEDGFARKTRTPGRMIPEEDMKILMNKLAGMGRWGPRTQWFLISGVASGARPVEWPDAEWADQEKTILRLFTAKVKNNNALDKIPPMTLTAIDHDNEVDRMWDARAARGVEGAPSWYSVDFERRIATLDLSDQDLEELRASRHKNGVRLFRDVEIEPSHLTFVRVHMESIKRVITEVRNDPAITGPKTDAAIFSKHYFDCARQCILRASKKAFADGRLYSLSDTRSTFSANRKAAVGNQAASKELGHASITTSRDFYAPASKAWEKYKPQNAQRSGQGDSNTSLPKSVSSQKDSKPSTS